MERKICHGDEMMLEACSGTSNYNKKTLSETSDVSFGCTRKAFSRVPHNYGGDKNFQIYFKLIKFFILVWFGRSHRFTSIKILTVLVTLPPPLGLTEKKSGPRPLKISVPEKKVGPLLISGGWKCDQYGTCKKYSNVSNSYFLFKLFTKLEIQY